MDILYTSVGRLELLYSTDNVVLSSCKAFRTPLFDVHCSFEQLQEHCSTILLNRRLLFLTIHWVGGLKLLKIP